jgi:hypothetical protein
MKLFLGFNGYYGTRLGDDPSRAERVASLLVDPRWPWPPWWALFWLRDDFFKSTRSRKVIGAKGSAVIANAIAARDYQRVFVYRSSKEVDDFAGVSVETGERLTVSDHEHPLEVWGLTQGFDLPAGKDLKSWVAMVHELMVALDVGCATIPVFRGKGACLNDVTLSMRVTLSDVDFQPPDYPRQNNRAIRVREKLGGTYVRHPRWGNYLGLEHVAKIGGIDRIRSEVAPAQLIELGKLVFIGLTEDPRDALTAECERKRAALELLMAPIVAPPQANEEPIVLPP